MRSALVLSHHNVEFEGLLYPLMVIAAVAVIAFSLLGIANLSGWLPNVLRSSDTIEVSAAAPVPPARAFGCAECGVIESVQRVADKAPD